MNRRKPMIFGAALFAAGIAAGRLVPSYRCADGSSSLSVFSNMIGPRICRSWKGSNARQASGRCPVRAIRGVLR